MLLVLSGEHQLEEGCVLRGEMDVGRRGGTQARREVLTGAVDCPAQLGAKSREPCLGESVEARRG